MWKTGFLSLLFVTAVISCGSRSSARESEADQLITFRKKEDQDSLQGERLSMVETQIKYRGVKDERVLEAMRKVPRHEFVPKKQVDQAYNDYPLQIGYGQTISQPYIVALMTELLRVGKDDRVLEIGTGSGYQAAVLAELAAAVYTIEIVEPLAEEARKTLDRLGYTNITIRTGDGFYGWPEAAPFDGVIVTAAPEKVPQPLLDQLKEGGRLVIPEGRYYQDLVVYEKSGGKTRRREVIPVRFVPMTGKAEEK